MYKTVGEILTSKLKLILISVLICTSVPLGLASSIDFSLEGHFGGESQAIAYSGNYLYISQGSDIVVLNVNNSSVPVEISRTYTNQDVLKDIEIVDDYAYVVDRNSLLIMNISNPLIFDSVGEYTSSLMQNVADIKVVGNHAYVTDWTNGFLILNVSNPYNPVLEGRFYTGEYMFDAAVQGNYAYLTDACNDLIIVNVSNPMNPTQEGQYNNTSGSTESITVKENYAYLLDSYDHFVILNVSNPFNPTLVGQSDTGYGNDVKIIENNAYVICNNDGLSIINVSDHSNPTLCGQYDIEGSVYSTAFNDNKIYVTTHYGLEIIDVVDSATPTLVGQYNSIVDAWSTTIEGNNAYVCNNYEGIVILNISDFSNPTFVGQYKTPTIGQPKDVAIVENYAYVADWVNGLMILNVSDPTTPLLIGQCNATKFANDITIVGNYAYITELYNGLEIVDISNPLLPTLIGHYNNTTVHPSDAEVVGNYAYIVDEENGLLILNASDPFNLTLTGQYDTAGSAYGIAVAENYAYIADYNNGLLIINITNPFNPTLVGQYDTTGSAYDVTVEGKYAYVADETKIVAVNVDDCTNPYQAAEYDTAGYAYGVVLKENNLFVSDWTNGLVILQIINNSVPIVEGCRIWDENAEQSTTYTWNARSFSGFFYDLESGLSSETMTICNIDRSLGDGDIVYQAMPMETDFEHTDWGSYQIIGFMAEEYFAGYIDDTDIDGVDELSMLSSCKLSKVLIDNDEENSVNESSSLELEEGYSLKLVEIDTNNGTANVTLSKDDINLDNAIVFIHDDYTYKSNLGALENVTTIVAHFNETFTDNGLSGVIIEGIFQMSEDYLNLEDGSTFGQMEITAISSDFIEMENEDSISLYRGGTINLMDNINLIVADNSDLRFAPCMDMSEPGTYELRGTFVEGDETFTWTPLNFEGFYYDIDEGIQTATLELTSISGRTIDDGDLVHTSVTASLEFEHPDWGEFDVISFMGEKYFAGYTSNTCIDGVEEVSLMSDGHLSKVLIDDDDNKSAYVGSALILKEGYKLNIIEIDEDTSELFINLTKDDEEIDNRTVSYWSDYIYETDMGNCSNVSLIAVHFDERLTEGEVTGVSIEGIFQISDNSIEIVAGDSYERMEITSWTNTCIVMENEDSIALSRGNIINVSDNIYFKVADDSSLRYYPYVIATTPSLELELLNPADDNIQSTVGSDQRFDIATNSICNFTWMVDDIEVQVNNSTNSASYLTEATSTGYYNVTVIAETQSEVIQQQWNWTVTTDSSNTGSSTPSGGGGGGGSTTGEDYENILVKDVLSIFINKDTHINYEFTKEGDAITSVQFDSLKNSGKIQTIVEVLNDRSAFADVDAPGTVYQQMNIWVGKSGFVNSDNVENLLITFKVEKSWLEENNIEASTVNLYRYADGSWNTLPTSITEEDEEIVYFEASTPGFSPFAIGSEAEVTKAVDIVEEDSLSNNEGTEDIVTDEETETSSNFTAILGVLGGISVLIVGGYVVYNKRS